MIIQANPICHPSTENDRRTEKEPQLEHSSWRPSGYKESIYDFEPCGSTGLWWINWAVMDQLGSDGSTGQWWINWAVVDQLGSGGSTGQWWINWLRLWVVDRRIGVQGPGQPHSWAL
ncbi:hypothetical protein Q7C36_010205 [Tachysurus vachellii]|uniref:Uncharacterized protein n=1 Tax=Tachysurus vachellii TaxID=175792 RepID=A0AA88MXV1_TACVA|nr:hypothetical protein Q7C36_010205 [Tachysurus vachellii]